MTPKIESNDERSALADRFAAESLAGSTWCHLWPDISGIDPAIVFEEAGRVSRRVRGRKMSTWDKFYDELAAAWQFGEFFGENLNAVDDCMRTLNHQLPTSTGYVVVITSAEQVLSEERSLDDLHHLVESFQMYAEDYAEPIEGPDWDLTARPALGFDVVLVADAEHRDAVLATWRAAGAPL